LSSAPFFVGAEALALSADHKASLKRELHFLIQQNPKYVWGGTSELSGGLDCSGYVFLASKRAGIPGVTRTTSFRMSLGLGGWRGREVTIGQAQDCDLVFWTFYPNRLEGHVGILMSAGPRPFATHASFKHGVVLRELKGPLYSNLTKVRRLTIGDE
jgi:cell wall-associated NlpC family hydrolase